MSRDGGAKKPKKTAQEKAMEIRQSRDLDQEIAESERKFKSLARGKLGAQSLLAGTDLAGSRSVASAAPKSKYGKPKKVKPLMGSSLSNVNYNELP